MCIPQKLGKGLLHFPSRGMAVAADANYQGGGAKNGRLGGKDIGGGDDDIGRCRIIGLDQTGGQGGHHLVAVKEEVAAIDQQAGGGGQLLSAWWYQTLIARPQVEGDQFQGVGGGGDDRRAAGDCGHPSCQIVAAAMERTTMPVAMMHTRPS